MAPESDPHADSEPAGSPETEPSDTVTLYEAVGGAPFFERLVDAFYDGVATDDVLLPMYPEQPDLTGARERLTLFLIQYWGGPTAYSDQRGHPRLRLRHMPFHVGPDERDRWLLHMRSAVTTACADGSVPDGVADALLGYFEPAAEHLRNDTGLPISSARP
ncbi:MAG: globin [Actinomycetota bacterium]